MSLPKRKETCVYETIDFSRYDKALPLDDFMIKINNAISKMKKDNVFGQNISVSVSFLPPRGYLDGNIILSFAGKRLQTDEEYAKTCERSRKSKEAAAKRKANKANGIMSDAQVFKKLAKKLGYTVRKK